MKPKIKNRSNRIERHKRLRRKIFGTVERPRLNVYRSLKHFEAQLINDLEGKVICSLSTRDQEFKDKTAKEAVGNQKAAQKLGAAFAKKAKDQGVKAIVFDRGGYLYHGRVKAFADALRESGLEF